MALSSIAIAVFGFLVWAHHMFVAGISLYAALVFSLLSYLVAVPSAIKVFNWTATMYKGSISFSTPMLYAFGFIGLFTMGGLTGLFLAASASTFTSRTPISSIAHFHYIMVGGAVMGYLGGMHFWWPKISGRMYPEGWGELAALIVFIGFNLTFFPQFVLGYLGMPRRYWQYPPEFQVLNVLSTAGSTDSGGRIPAAHGVFPVVACATARSRRDNPWNAAGLEWQTASPPPTFNFEETPVVTWEAYDYDEMPHEEVTRWRIVQSRSQLIIRALLHHFADLEQQRDARRSGMWLFLVTEVMFFGGLFCAYLIYRLVLPRFRRRQQVPRHHSGHGQYRRADLQ